MTQAKSVHSTPRETASKINLPIDQARRNLLSATVGAVALAIVPALPAAAAVDPVFELIAIHRKTHIAHMASLELQNRLERQHDSRADWVSTKPCHDEADAFEALIAAPAITPQGLLAKLAYLQELASEFETEWMIDELVYPLGLIQSFAASLKNIGVQP
jgi:hypothetical protein